MKSQSIAGGPSTGSGDEELEDEPSEVKTGYCDLSHGTQPKFPKILARGLNDVTVELD